MSPTGRTAGTVGRSCRDGHGSAIDLPEVHPTCVFTVHRGGSALSWRSHPGTTPDTRRDLIAGAGPQGSQHGRGTTSVSGWSDRWGEVRADRRTRHPGEARDPSRFGQAPPIVLGLFPASQPRRLPLLTRGRRMQDGRRSHDFQIEPSKHDPYMPTRIHTQESTPHSQRKRLHIHSKNAPSPPSGKSLSPQ